MVHVLASEAAPGTVGVAQDLRIDPAASFYESPTAGMPASAIPCGLHQQPSEVTVARLLNCEYLESTEGINCCRFGYAMALLSRE